MCADCETRGDHGGSSEARGRRSCERLRALCESRILMRLLNYDFCVEQELLQCHGSIILSSRDAFTTTRNRLTPPPVPCKPRKHQGSHHGPRKDGHNLPSFRALTIVGWIPKPGLDIVGFREAVSPRTGRQWATAIVLVQVRKR